MQGNLCTVFVGWILNQIRWIQLSYKNIQLCKKTKFHVRDNSQTRDFLIR